MKTCKEVATLLSQDIDGELSMLNRVVLQAHLVVCGVCRQIHRQLRLLELALQKRDEAGVPVTTHGLSEDANVRLKRALRSAIEDVGTEGQ